MQVRLEEILGYRFTNASLLDEALTTPSFRMTSPGAHDNQRLEFLGDAVLGLLATDWLYAHNPASKEGELTGNRQHMVSMSIPEPLPLAVTVPEGQPRLRFTSS